MFSPGMLATTFPTNLFIQRSFCLTPASLQCSLSITNWKPPLPNLNIRGCFPPECHHIAVCAVNSTLCVKSVNWPFNLISIFIYSCCSKWFALVKTPWGPPSVALHTSSTCSRGCDSFDIIFPLLMEVRSEKKKKKKKYRENARGNLIQLGFLKEKDKDKQLNLKSIKNWLCPQERRSDSGYDLILAQVFSECWHLRVVRNPEPAAYSGGFSDTVFTRHEEVGALQQTAPYTALSIISHSIHENRSTAGSTVWTAKL